MSAQNPHIENSFLNLDSLDQSISSACIPKVAKISPWGGLILTSSGCNPQTIQVEFFEFEWRLLHDL